MRPHRPTPRPLTVAVLALGLLGGCSGIATQDGSAPLPADTPYHRAPTADAAVRSTPVVPGRAARVSVFAGFGDKCEAWGRRR